MNGVPSKPTPMETSKPEPIKSSELDRPTDGDPKYAHLTTKRSSAALLGAFWSAINSFVPTLLNSLVFVVSSRYLMPHDFGIVALTASVISMAGAFAPAAFGEAMIQQKHIRRCHLDTVFWLCAISSLLIYGILVTFSPMIATKISQPAISVFLPILGLKLFFDVTAVVPYALIVRAMSFHLLAMRTIITAVISGAISIILLMSGYGIWALVISQLTVSIVGWLAAFLAAKWLPGFEISIKALRDLYQYTLFASGNRFISAINPDQIIIGSIIGPAPLGIFNFSRRMFQMLNDVLSGSLASVSHTLLSSLQTEKSKMREAFLLATYGASIIAFPAFIGLAAIAGDVIPLVFGIQWDDAIWPTRWFCMIGIMSCIGVIQSSLITSQGKNHWWFYYQLFQQAITILVLILLVNRGINVIVMAMALQTLFVWPITLVMVTNIIDIKITAYLRHFVEPMLSSILMLVTVLVIAYIFRQNSPAIRLTTEIIFAIFTYTLAIYIFSRDKILTIVRAFLNRNKPTHL